MHSEDQQKRIALGTAQFGSDYGVANQSGEVSVDEGRAILDCAWDHGITTVDTAMAYGTSERKLGELGVSDWDVVSKLPSLSQQVGSLDESIFNSVKKSLDTLKIDCLYGLLLHRPLELLSDSGGAIYGALEGIKKDGLVKKIGISVYSPSELDALVPRYQFDVVQLPFSLLDRRFLTSGWLDRLKDHQVEIHARSIFLQGLLLMSRAAQKEKFVEWSALWSAMDGWLSFHDLSALEACLRCALSCTQLDRVIVGVDGSAHLREILSSCSGAMPDLPTELVTEDLRLLIPSWQGRR